MTGSSGTYLSEDEMDREFQVRLLACPRCGVAPEERCRYGKSTQVVSHTGRYNRAVKCGLVPPLRPAPASGRRRR